MLGLTVTRWALGATLTAAIAAGGAAGYFRIQLGAARTEIAGLEHDLAVEAGKFATCAANLSATITDRRNEDATRDLSPPELRDLFGRFPEWMLPDLPADPSAP